MQNGAKRRECSACEDWGMQNGAERKMQLALWEPMTEDREKEWGE